MSLGVVIKGPEGVVLAADSRVTLQAQREGGEAHLVINFDNATKLLSFSKPHNFVGAVTYGAAVIGLRTAHSYVSEFESKLSEERLSVLEYSKTLSDFFMDHWKDIMPQEYPGPDMVFIMGGFDPGDAYGKVFLFRIPRQPEPEPRNPGLDEFGMTWGGQLEIVSRLIHGYDPGLLEIVRRRFNLNEEQIGDLVKELKGRLEYGIPYQVLPLQDCIDLAVLLIRTTITAQDLAIRIRGVGGPIDVAYITRTGGLEYVQQKKLRGEIK